MRRVGPVLWAVVVLLTCLPPLASAYAAAWALPVLAACVILPFGLAALGRLARVPRWSVATAGLVVGVVVALVFADRVDPSSGTLPAWRSSPAFSALGPLIDAVPRLLTAPRPAPADPSLLVPAALIAWIVALGVAVAVVGARRAGVAPLVGAVVLHGAGALLTAGRGDVLGTSALATALALLLGWVLLPATEAAATTPSPSTRTRSRQLRRRRRGIVLPAIAATVVATFALVAVAVPTARSFEPRTLVPPPQLPADAVNPVPQAAVWAQQPSEEMFTVTAVDGALPERLALAVLPDYTGVAWTLDAHLRPVGVVATPDTAPATATRTATYAVGPLGYAEAWLPTAGIATEVSGVPALLDLDTGTAVLPGGWAAAGAAPVATITSRINAATPEAIGRASVPQASDVQRYLELPRAPQELTQAAQLATEGAANRWEEVSLLADAVLTDSLRRDATGEERVLDHGARSGSSYARIAQFLFDTPEEGGQVGTSEQFAASFAVLARTLGIPTRLVVGFEVPDDGSGTATVLGEDARVWAEVYLSRVGWVAVDPSPDSAISTDLPTPEADAEGGDDPEPDPTPDAEDRDVVEPDDQPAAAPPALPGLVVWVLLGAAMLGVLGLAVARAARQARWRRAGEPGAWASVEDALVLAGRPPPNGATAVDLAASLPDGVAPTAVALAERAEARAYAPEGAPAADGDPSAWAMSRSVSRELRREAPWPRRLLWLISPRVWRR